MNRAMKRQAERENLRIQKEPLITIKRSEMMKIINKEIKIASEIVQNDAMRNAVRDLTSAFVLSLHYLGWSRNMVDRLLKSCNKAFDKINKGEYTIDDIKHTCEHYDLDFEMIYGKEDCYRGGV